jgi:pyrroline-5-carboxylate reductase
MKDERITFIGGGNMARSLIGGLIGSGTAAENICVGEPLTELRESLAQDFGIKVLAENESAIKHADVIVLAVKPQVMREALTPLGTLIRQTSPLLISIAAGIPAKNIERWAGSQPALVRVMPNTPALVGAGMSALFANENASTPQRNLAESIMRSVGTTVWLEKESLMDVVTAVSGSGPAYFFYLMEAIEQAGIREGLDADTARLLALETALGAARLALESTEGPGQLRERVTSPGGTTEAAIRTLDASNVSDIMQDAVAAARQRSAELAGNLEDN